MLDKTDTERLFAAARRRGLADCELFAETAYHTAIEMVPMTAGLRVEGARTWTSGGLALRGYDGITARQFATRGFQVRQLLTMLDGAAAEDEPTALTDLPPLVDPNRRPFSETEAKVNALLQSLRAMQALESEGVQRPAIRWQDTLRHFVVIAPDGSIGRGTDESAEVSADWTVEHQGQRLRFAHRRAASRSSDLLALCDGRKALVKAVRASLGLRTAWPGPGGPVPVLWSPLALSKILIQFLRAFEGDRVLGNGSFLNDLSLPVPLPFAILDQPDTAISPCDLEGSPRRPIVVFQEGRPRALAVNRHIAAQLCVPSTGHGRRDRLDAAATVGFWQVGVRGKEEVPGLSQSLSGGLSVQDLEVRHYDAKTGALRLEITGAYLVHGGAEGECVEPFTLDINLIELLQTLVAFSDTPETTGLVVEKDHQRLMTEITVGAALSESLELPGKVPASHYW